MSEIDWRSALREWLKTNSPKTPPDLEQLRQDFVRRFPRERLGQMTLEDYALGQNVEREKIQDTFCYWLEFRTRNLCAIGGTATKWGVWWNNADGRWDTNRIYSDGQEAIEKIRSGLAALTQAAAERRFDELDKIGDELLGVNRNMMRAKTLFMYFPDQFLPIAHYYHLGNFLKAFGQKPAEGAHRRNRQLLAYLRSLPEFAAFDTVPIMYFLYAYNLHIEKVHIGDPEALDETISHFLKFRESPQYFDDEYDYKHKYLIALGKPIQALLDKNLSTLEPLFEVFKQPTFTNLISWQEGANALNIVKVMPPELFGEALSELLSDENDIKDRIEQFTQTLWETADQHNLQRPPLLAFASLLMMAANPDKYIHYRWGPLEAAIKSWKITPVPNVRSSDADKFGLLIDLALILRTKLTEALSSPADMIDVHTLLYFNHTDIYSEFKAQASTDEDSTSTLPSEYRELIQRTQNIILHGPPGTGKTFLAKKLLDFIGPKRSHLIAFHQSFAYEEFIEGLRPETTPDGQITYKVTDGVFKQICAQAASDPDQYYLLIIDEINRGNIAKIFGELLTLLEDDKRGKLTVTLPYSKTPFTIPRNLIVVGTMNTADRSIALLDVALRRRFVFIELMPNPKLLQNLVEGINLAELLSGLNERIANTLGRDYQIGHSYLMNVNSLADLRFQWTNRLLPLLREYFYDDTQRLREVIGDDFFADQSDSEFATLSDDKFRKALLEICKLSE